MTQDVYWLSGAYFSRDLELGKGKNTSSSTVGRPTTAGTLVGQEYLATARRLYGSLKRLDQQFSVSPEQIPNQAH